jgi:SRSO17 transposase
MMSESSLPGGDFMVGLAEFDCYMAYLCEGLGNSMRHQSLLEYCSGLMLPIQRKSIEPLAAHADPLNVPAKHQALHHFVANARWSDRVLLERIREYVEPHLRLEHGAYWIIDDTAHPKCGRHSVGVARQYCGRLGKQDNCQVAVSLSLASAEGSVPVDYRLYLPEAWAHDAIRRREAKVPEAVQFATKSQIALEQVRAAKQRGLMPGIVLADAGYGRDTAFREALDELELNYVVGVSSSVTVWAPGTGPLPTAAHRGRGRPHTRLRRGPGHEPVSVKELAFALQRSAWRRVAWREGTNKVLSSRFARVRVRAAHRDYLRTRLREEQWLLIEWPLKEPEPTKYWLSNMPADISLTELVNTAKMRWRIEQDYHELKSEFGLSHYEGRGWTGFHHHATVCIAAYGFLLAQRLQNASKKNSAGPTASALPEDYRPRGSRPRAAPCAGLDSHTAPSREHRDRTSTSTLPVLRGRRRASVTQYN